MVNYGLSKNFVFKEAVQFLKGKTVLTKDEYMQLTEESRLTAFTVAGYTEANVLQTFLEKLTAAIEEGTTKETFYQDINAYLTGKGQEGLDPFRADVIFRTNTQTAFNAGHYKTMSDLEVIKYRPYWEYVTAGDGRERESHAAMAGRIYAADDPIWNVWYPPNGYRCRCTVVSRTAEYAKRKGLNVSTKPPYDLDYQTGEIKTLFPDKGFSNNPAKATWKPDISNLSPLVKAAYKEHQKVKG